MARTSLALPHCQGPANTHTHTCSVWGGLAVVILHRIGSRAQTHKPEAFVPLKNLCDPSRATMSSQGKVSLQAKPSQHKSACSVATLPGSGRLQGNKQTATRNVERGIKIEQIMQGAGSRRGDGGVRNDQENHQKPSGMPAYI